MAAAIIAVIIINKLFSETCSFSQEIAGGS